MVLALLNLVYENSLEKIYSWSMEENEEKHVIEKYRKWPEKKLLFEKREEKVDINRIFFNKARQTRSYFVIKKKKWKGITHVNVNNTIYEPKEMKDIK